MMRMTVSACVAGLVVGCGGSTPPPKTPEACSPQIVHVSVLAAPNLNPTPEGQSRPVVLRLYQLKADARLLNAPFERIWKEDKATLEDDLAKVDEVQLYPGSRTELKFERNPAVQHLAAAGLFQNPRGRGWFHVVDLPPVPEPGRCNETCKGDSCEATGTQNPVFSFWVEGSKVDDGSDHVDAFPKTARERTLQLTPAPLGNSAITLPIPSSPTAPPAPALPSAPSAPQTPPARLP